MPKFIYAFHGGSKPGNEEDMKHVMVAWDQWLKDLGDRVIDPGHPVGPSMTVTGISVEDNGGTNPLSGYTLIEADTIDKAVELTKGCPIFKSGGSVEIAEAIDMN